MTKIVCDFCADDVDVNDQYRLALEKQRANVAPAFKAGEVILADLCGRCAKDIVEFKNLKTKPV